MPVRKTILGILVAVEMIAANYHLLRAADRIRFAYPAKSLNYLPVMLARIRASIKPKALICRWSSSLRRCG
jgi:hypothetical protein